MNKIPFIRFHKIHVDIAFSAAYHKIASFAVDDSLNTLNMYIVNELISYLPERAKRSEKK